MENLDQTQLLYLNLALLMFTASIALYLPKKMQKAQNPKPKVHPEIAHFYKVLNESLKIRQPKLTYIVDKINIDTFIPFYKGLEYIHGFKLDLKTKRLTNGLYSEYIVLDLDNYTGPRTVEVAMYEEKIRQPRPMPVTHSESSKPNWKPSVQSVGNVVSIFGGRKSPAQDQNFSNVVDLNSYRKNRGISYIPDGNEGA